VAKRKTAGTGDCRALLTRLFAYLDGELGPRDYRAVERHLEKCHCCGPFAESLRKTMVLCREAGAPEVPPAVRRTARARVKALLSGQGGASADPSRRRTRE
jgi:anti-sigma factor RsiW